MQKGATTVLDLLFITFQTYLPSEPSARVQGLTSVEAPLRAAKNFQEALTTLRSWRQQIITVVKDLGGNPEPHFRTAQVKNRCTDETLLHTMEILEIELAARGQEDDEERRKRGQAHHTAAPAMGQGPAKGRSKDRRGAGQGE